MNCCWRIYDRTTEKDPTPRFIGTCGAPTDEGEIFCSAHRAQLDRSSEARVDVLLSLSNLDNRIRSWGLTI